MKTQINPPSRSKINFAAAIQAAVNVAIYTLNARGYIPDTAVVDALALGNTVSAALIYVFRTWFTKP